MRALNLLASGADAAICLIQYRLSLSDQSVMAEDSGRSLPVSLDKGLVDSCR